MNAPATRNQTHHSAKLCTCCPQHEDSANGWIARKQFGFASNHWTNRLLAWRSTWACLLVVGALSLAGCASPRLEATVTRFHQWPAATQGASYTIAPMSAPVFESVQTPPAPLIAPEPVGQPLASAHMLAAPTPVALPTLEYQTYASYLDQALQAKGLVPAARPEQARLLAHFAVSAQQGVVRERVLTMRPMLWLGYGGFGWRSGFGMNMSYDDYDNDLFGWRERTVTRPVQSYRLHVTVQDRGQLAHNAKGQAGRRPNTAPTVLEAQAQYIGRPVPLAVVMPYLMRAVFEDFPGVNGQTKRVVFDTQTGERK